MAVANGYGKIVTSGSVFMYDVGDTYNSYKGQPGTNITTGVNKVYNGYNKITYDNGMFFETNGYTEVVNIPALGPTTVQSVEINNAYCGYGCNGNYQCCPTLFTYTGGWMSSIWSPGQTYSYQIIYKCTSGYTHPNFMYHYEYNSSEGYLTEYGVFTTDKQESLGDGWYHAWNTFTTNASAAKGYTGLWYYNYNVADKVSIAAVSISPGDTIRPPREIIPSGTTRSATQGLLPIVGNSTLNLSNVSFDTNAQMTFDGTDDRFNTGIGNIGNNTSFAAVINSSGNATTYNMYMGQLVPYMGALTGNRIIFSDYINSIQQTINTSVGTIITGQNHYVVCTREYDGTNTTNKVYIDGKLSTSGTFSGAPTYYGDNIHIGDGQTSAWYPFYGKINVVQIYNRTLSSSEVQQNYSKYKSRFNLS